jgi:hypothetical protein
MVLEANMTITYQDGRTVEGIILSKDDGTMRIAVNGGGDVVEFVNLFGTWISEDSQLVQIQSSWDRIVRKEMVSEADCICPKEIAARLIHLLLSGSDEDELEAIHSVAPWQVAISCAYVG